MRDRLLFVSQTLPFPPDSGVKARAFHTLRILSSAFDITALCFFRRRQTGGPEGVQQALDGLRPYADVTAFPIPQEWSPPRKIRDHVSSLAWSRPYTDYVFRDQNVLKSLRHHVESERHRIVHMESQSLSQYMPDLGDAPSVCVHHNVESQLLRRRARVHRLPASWYLRHQARLLEASERVRCPGFDLNVTVSEADAEELRAISPDARFVSIPNGVDTDFFAPANRESQGIALLGGTDWFPNLDGLQHFADEVLPHIRLRHPDVRVVSVGRAGEEETRRFRADYGIELTGYVEDIRPWIQAARCVVVPLRVGGGSRLKILDSWSMGRPVVTTSIGCEGLGADDGVNALIRDEPRSFADAVIDVLEKDELCRSLSEQGRATAVASYSWDAIGELMLAEYERLLA
jgi:glycosyltransferase involved in cell wall biosynthesis